MLSTTFLTRALVLAVACATTMVTAAPADPASAKMLAAIADLKDLGIDINGPVPDDYTSYDAETGLYEFDEGTKFSAWARAQIAASSLPEEADPRGLEKRNSGVNIGMWRGTWCSGSGFYIANVVYGTSYWSGVFTNPYISVGIGGRSLGAWEQLDFSSAAAPNGCGNYLYSAGAVTPPGCWNSMSYNCFRLWLK